MHVIHAHVTDYDKCLNLFLFLYTWALYLPGGGHSKVIFCFCMQLFLNYF